MSEREELAALLEGPYAAGVYAQDGRRISTASRFLTESDAESVAGIVLASPWLRAHDDRIRAESAGYTVDAYAEGKGVMRDWLEREIRALHVNNDGPIDWCVGCYESQDEQWPCRTLQILGDPPPVRVVQEWEK